MWYVEVVAADTSYHRDVPLTYASKTRLAVGQIVLVPLRQKQPLGIVASEVNRPNFATKEVALVPPLPLLPKVLTDLLAWMQSYYPAPLGLTAQLFLPDSLPKKALPTAATDTITQKPLPDLTKDQRQTLQSINAAGLHILHGDTGTGKTRVYLELAIKAFKEGKSSIVLTPEIGLTPQIVNDFRSTFGERVVVMHSGLTQASRRQTWQWLLHQKDPVVVVGARSALFSPLPNVGLIVVDEEHETSYKQDQAPYYHASTVAGKLSSLHQATLVLGSATPLVSDYFIAQTKKRPIVRMTQIAAKKTSEEPLVQIVDLKERELFRRSHYLSDPLLTAMQEKLQQHEQILLFLNRRGTARVIFCEKCSWQAACPHCDLPLVYHDDHHVIRCHSCSYKTGAPTSCPSCQSVDIVFRSIGTKAIVNEVKRLFPEAKVMRFDTDNKKAERLDAQYDAVRSGAIDILVGTQTLGKGLDLPHLGLVGVILADASLYFPDFSAQERTYQLLSQVLGRIGRGHRKSMAVIQTYSPKSPLLQSVVEKRWSMFYNDELKQRQKFLFPPFCYLLKLTCKRSSSQNAQKTAESLASQLREQNYKIVIDGPTPAFRAKTQNKFSWQLIIKAKRREQLTRIIRLLPSGWSYDIDPMNLL